jgi:hypothetical protein
MRAYHFTNTTHAISDLAMKRLKVSRISQLNDPFEFLAADLLDPRHFRAFSDLKEQLDRSTGLICFSGSWRNPLLWGHYADKHSGVALGFDIQDDQVLKVNYTADRAPVKFDVNSGKVVDDRDVVDRLLRTKFADWRYEDEYRIFLNLDSESMEGGHYFVDFSPELHLREVILGMRCDLSMKRVRQLLGVDSDSVKVLKAGMAKRSFRLIEDRQFRGSKTS